MNTISRPRAPELPEPQDPWAESAPIEPSSDLTDLPSMSREEEDSAFQGIVENYHTEAPSGAHNEQTGVKPNRATEEYTPTPVSVTERRATANKQATLALAHTLRHTNPELLKEANQAIYGEATQVILPPQSERPEVHEPRHRRRGLLGRIAARFTRR